MGKPVVVPGWLLLAVVIVIGANLVAGLATSVTVHLMQSVSPFALAVREHDFAILPVWRCVTYPLLTGLTLLYLWPLDAFFRCGGATEPSAAAQRRAVNGPFVMAAAGFSGWVSSALMFPVVTVVHFGRWTPELASQHILSPLVNGFLAATTSYREAFPVLADRRL